MTNADTNTLTEDLLLAIADELHILNLTLTKMLQEQQFQARIKKERY